MSTKPDTSAQLVITQKVETSLQQIDAFIQENNLGAILEKHSPLLADAYVGMAISKMREMLTPEVMAVIMQLQGSPLGFRTDRDRNKDGSKGPGYDVETVREVSLDLFLRGGFRLSMNESNIIAGRGYITREGFTAWFKRAAKAGICTYPSINIGVPKVVGEGAIVGCSAACKVGGKDVTVTADIQVKGSGADQLVGKATRKILARLYEQVMGIPASDGDLSEGAIDVTTTPVTGASTTPPAETLDAETLEALTKLIGEHGDKATSFFVTNGNIVAGQTWQNISAKIAKKALTNRDGFLQAIGAK